LKESRNKYNAKKVVVDNRLFDSQAEGIRYTQLKQLLIVGEIWGLETQYKIELQPSFKYGNETIRAITYYADFKYDTWDCTVIEDVKGYRTEVYKLKKRLLLKYLTEHPTMKFIEVLINTNRRGRKWFQES